ncbi:hypothetical protein LguiA_001749 [Lonicera macranthoides]
MGLSGKEELSVEIKSPGEIFFDAFGTKKGLLQKICPNIIPLIDLLEGEWGTLGCTILVRYHLDHVYRSGVAKEKASVHDERLVYQAALQHTHSQLSHYKYWF